MASTSVFIGDRIRQRRYDLKLSIQELANMAGVPYGFIKSAEEGKTPILLRDVLVLARCLKTSAFALAGSGV